MKSYKQKKYEQALIETYLKFDELLRMDKVNQVLIKQANTQANSDIKVDFTVQISSPDCSKESEMKKFDSQDNIKSNEKNTFRSKESNESKKSDDNESKKTPTNKEVIMMNNQKFEINLQRNSSDLDKAEHFDHLIAKDMGTTANIVFIKNSQLYIANVGDSLGVMFKNGQAIRLNVEHKTTLPSESTRINKSGAKIINNRIDGRLNLTRAIGNILIILGDLNFKNNNDMNFYEQAVTAYPQINSMKITKDCDFIIMGCDGVWDCVDAQKLCEHVSLRLKANVKISEIIADLLDKIIAKTNNSNVVFKPQPPLVQIT